MKQGVILCGLNGSGKSTLGRALAQRLGWEFLDIEDCFFPKTDPSCLYANPRSPQEAAALLVERHRRGKLCAGQRERPLPRAGAAAHRGGVAAGGQGHPGPAGAAALL